MAEFVTEPKRTERETSEGRGFERPSGGQHLLTVQEVASFLRVPIRTLYGWRYHGEGPPAIRIGRYLRYRWTDVEEWLAKRSEDSERTRGGGRMER